MVDERTSPMDGTAVYYKGRRMQTVDAIGSKHVMLISTGFESMRITDILAMIKVGCKQTPAPIGKNKAFDRERQ